MRSRVGGVVARALPDALVLVTLGLLCSGCGPVLIGVGAFVATLDSGSSSSGGSTTQAPSVALQTPAATATAAVSSVGVVITDARSGLASIQVTYTATDLDTGQVLQGTATPAAGTSTQNLVTSAGGIVHTFGWDYVRDLGPGAARATLDVTAVTPSGTSVLATTDPFLVGNDAPQLVDSGLGFVRVSGNAGNVLVEFDLADSSGDVCAVDATFAAPTLGTQTITALIQSPVTNLSTRADGSASSFTLAWDTLSQGQIAQTIVNGLTVSITPRDANGAVGAAHTSAAFSVSNNTVPSVTVGEPSVSFDFTREISLEVTIVDLQSDPVSLQLQWSRATTFPAYPQNALAIRTVAQGARVELPDASLPGPFDASNLFLPHLIASVSSAVASHPFLGRTLEVLEPPGTSSIAFAPALTDPVGVLVEPGDTTCLVTDRAAGGSLSRVTLSTGAVTPLVSALGTPEYLAFEPGNATVLVSDAAGRVLRLDRSTLAQTPIATGLGQPRGIAALTSRIALVLEEGTGRLLQLDSRAGLPATVTPLAGGLSTPRGLALDRERRQVYVAERGANRITRIALDTRARQTITTSVTAPSGLLLADRRSLYVTSEQGATSTLEVVNVENPNLTVRRIAQPLNAPLSVSAESGARRLFALENGAGQLRRVVLDRAVRGTSTIAQVTSTTLRLSAPLPSTPSPGDRVQVQLGSSLSGLASSPTGIKHVLRLAIPKQLGRLDGLFFRVAPSDAPAGAGIPVQTLNAKAFLGGAFSTRTLISTSPRIASKIEGGDLDGDGDKDLLCVNAADLTIFLQSAPNVFSATPVVLSDALMVSPNDAALGDLDGDGDLDLVSSNATNVTIFLQTSPGAFGGATALTAGTTPVGVALGDLDGDGDLDLVVANQGSDDLTVFQQTAPATFTPVATLSAAGLTSPRDVSLGDMDGDGDLEVVVACAGTNALGIFPQTAAISFGAPTILPAATGAQALAVGDVDTDGDLDLYCGGTSGQTLHLQTAPGSFATTNLSGATDRVALGDADGDGLLDLFATRGSTGVGVHFQTSAGVFDATERPISPLTPVGLFVGDLDGSFGPELVVSESGTPQLILHRHTSPYGLTQGTNVSLGGNLGGNATAVGDLDGDGDMDFVVCVRNTGEVKLYFQSAQAIFGTASPVVLSGFNQPQALDLADLDGDGDLDIAIGTIPGVALYYQTSPGTFSAGPFFSTTNTASYVRVGDFDRDGDPDLVYSVLATLQVRLQVAPGSFGAPSTLTVTGLVSGIAVGDIDGDGDLDLLAGINATQAPKVFLQTAPGAFTAGADPPTTRLLNVDLVDVDGDGKLDLLAAADSSGIRVLLQTSPGVFGNLISIPISGLTRKVRAADLDGDGDLDLVSMAVSGSSAGIRSIHQTSPGVFDLNAGRLLSYANAVDMSVADLDGDGEVDVLLSRTTEFDLVFKR